MASTFITKFVDEKVCPSVKGYQGFIKLPFISVLAFLSPFPWLIIGLLTLIFYLAPCNPNLNCTSISKKKDGTKAFVIALLIVYLLILFSSAIAKVFVCNENGFQSGGGVMTNIQDLLQKIKV